MPENFDVDSFKDHLHTTWLGSEFIYIEQVDSTNSYLKQVPSSDLVHGTVVLTDHQKKGRGQYERKWEAAPYKNLTFTIAFCPKGAERFNLLSLATAYAITRGIGANVSDPVYIKWPNDIYVREKKMGGLLTECIFNGSKPDRVLIGIGLNVQQNRFSKQVRDSAISFHQVTNRRISREKLLAELLTKIERVYRRWHKHDEQLQNDISKRIIGYGDWVRISIDQKEQDQKFKFLGLSSQGELLMLNEQLDVNKFTYEQVRIITGHERIPESEAGPPV